MPASSQIGTIRAGALFHSTYAVQVWMCLAHAFAAGSTFGLPTLTYVKPCSTMASGR